MSASAGAPPPPPPPPPPARNSGFDDLPAELLMIIYRYIGMGQYTNLVFVLYPTLLRHGMVPELTETTLHRLFSRFAIPLFPPGCQSAISRVPMELWLQIADYGGPRNSIALQWALGLRFWPFQGRPSDEIIDQLRIWSRRGRGHKK